MRRALFAAVLAAAAGAAHADGLVYLGAGVAANKVSDVASINTDLNTTSWKVLAGVRPINSFAVEGNYLDLGSKTVSSGSTGGNAHVEYKAFAAYAVGFLPLPLPFLDLFGKAGLARWDSSGSNATSPGGSLFSLSDNGTEFAWGVGAQAHFGNIGGRLEYETFHIRDTSGANVVSLSVMLSL